MRFQFTNDARQSLARILHHISQDKKSAAVSVKECVFDTCESLSEMPDMGRQPEFAKDPGLLYFAVKKYSQYLIFYRKRKKGIVIIDVVHGARDLPAFFKDK